MDTLRRRGDAAPDRRGTGSRTATWCRRSSSGCWRCPRTSGRSTTCSSLRTMIHGAAPCPNEVKRAMLDWWGPVVVEYYAATEGGGATIFADEWLRKPGSVGKAWSYSVIKILDESERGGAGQRDRARLHADGRLDVRAITRPRRRPASRGPVTCSRSATSATWTTTATCSCCDRKSDMIISGGVNIYPAEIEGELVMHPAVADVAVFGVPDDEWGEAIKAVIQPAPGVVAGDELTAEIMAFAAERLAKYKLPKYVDYLAELPARRQRQALQAQAARPGVGRPREGDLAGFGQAVPAPPRHGRRGRSVVERPGSAVPQRPPSSCTPSWPCGTRDRPAGRHRPSPRRSNRRSDDRGRSCRRCRRASSTSPPGSSTAARQVGGPPRTSPQ